MKIVGITGGVGCGKSQVLSILKGICNCKIVQADLVANYLKEPGNCCYREVVDLLGEGILQEDGRIDNSKMAAIIFGDAVMLQQVNAIIHPAVKDYIVKDIQSDNSFDYYFLEAALLIESGFTSILEELWYIYTPKEVAGERLKSTRGYSDEKIAAIMSSQLSEEEFRKAADIVIDNGRDLDYTTEQLKKILNN